MATKSSILSLVPRTWFVLVGLCSPHPGSLAAQDWPMWGGSNSRNNVVVNRKGPLDWKIAHWDPMRKDWKPNEFQNVKWSRRLGTQTYGTPAVAAGKVFVGTNNAGGFVPTHPPTVDRGCVLCFRQSDGEFLWQYSASKLPSGRVHDWPLQGICSTPLVQGDRMWLVDNRGRVVCLDTEGFRDGQDDGEPLDWDEIATVPVLVDTAIWSIPAPLRAAFDDAGIILGQCGVSAAGREGQWKVRSRPVPEAPLQWFLVRREGPQLIAYRLPDGQAEEPGAKLFQIDNRLYPGIERGEVAGNLEKWLRDHGITLAGPRALTPITAGKIWVGAAQAGGEQHQLRMELTGDRLTVLLRPEKPPRNEADVVWRLDMMKELGVRQHNMATCAPAAWGDTLFVCTSNGVDESHVKIEAPEAPSFIAVDKRSGQVLWTDNSPGQNILHGQWSSPAVGELGGVPQVIFPAGDGWLYSFRADSWDEQNRRPILLWKFDCNPKESQWRLGGRSTRNELVAVPVISDGRVYAAVGQDPEHGEGEGHLWCIDPTRRGDVSPHLAMKLEQGQLVPIPHCRLQAVNREAGERAVDNPNSALIWHYQGTDRNGDGKLDFEEAMHRTISSPAIHNGLLVIPDFSGLVHCLDARTGKCHWTLDLLAACWTSPLILGDRVYIGDEDGEVAILTLSPDRNESGRTITQTNGNRTTTFDEPLRQIDLGQSIYTTPVFAHDTLFLATRDGLFAIPTGSAPR